MSSAQFGSNGLPRRRSTAAGVHWWFGTSPETAGQGSRKKMVEMTGRTTDGPKDVAPNERKVAQIGAQPRARQKPIPRA
jgi:hypothetical protein